PPGTCLSSDEHDHAAGVERATLSYASVLHDDSLHVPLTADFQNLVAQQKQHAELLDGDDEHRASFPDHAVCVDGLARQDVELGHEIASRVEGDHPRRFAAA